MERWRLESVASKAAVALEKLPRKGFAATHAITYIARLAV